MVQIGLAALIFVALAALGLGIMAFMRPLEATTTDDLKYTQAGAFSYTASAPAGLYDAGTAQTGEPIFRKLMSRVQLGFSYRVDAEQPHQLGGSYRMLAELSATDGWKRAIELQPATQFTGDSFTAQAKLDLAQVQILIDAMEQQAGVEHQYYTLEIVPQVALEGTLSGQALHDTFVPRLAFQLNALELQLQPDNMRTDDPLAPTQKGILKHEQLATANATDEAARIRRQYSQLLVVVQDNDLMIGDRVVEVATTADLARTAEHDERMILYARRGAVHYYIVPIAGVNYQYRSVEPAVALAEDIERHEP